MLDNIDKKLLFELSWNCRQTNTNLAKKLRISKQVVNYRIKRLEERGIIVNYFAVIDWRKLGYNSTRAYIKWRNIDPAKEEAIYEEMKNNPFFMWTVKLEGELDIATYMWVRDIPNFSKKWDCFLGDNRNYILKQEIYESINMTLFPFKLLAKDTIKEERVLGNGKAIGYDVKDYEILSILSQSAKMTAVDMANKTGLTPKVVVNRIKSLEKRKILLGYCAQFDPEKIGYVFYKLDFYLNDLSRIKEMKEFAKQHRKIFALMKTIGGPDFEIEIMVKDAIELKNIIREFVTKFSDVIEHYRFHRFERTIKQTYLPGSSTNILSKPKQPPLRLQHRRRVDS